MYFSNWRRISTHNARWQELTTKVIPVISAIITPASGIMFGMFKSVF